MEDVNLNTTQSYDKNRNNAKLRVLFEKKVNVSATLDSFEVGDELIFLDKDIRYITLYNAVRHYEKKRNKSFSVSISGIRNGTMVRRIL